MYLLLSVVGILFAWLLWSRRKFYYLSWKLKGKWGYPIVGSTLEFISRKQFLEYLGKTRDEYVHPTTFWAGPIPVLYVSDPVSIEKIFKSQSCVNKAIFYNAVSNNFGHSLFSMDNPDWSERRKAVNPAFRVQILKSFIPIFNRHTNIFMKTLDTYADGKSGSESMDLKRLIILCTLDVACETTMGKKITNQKYGTEDLLQSYHNVHILTIHRALAPWYYIDWIFRQTNLSKRLQAAKKPIHKFLRGLIKDRIVESAKDLLSLDDPDNLSKTKYIFVDQLLQYYHRNILSLEEIENESNSTIVAAFHTNENTISYTLMCMAMFPKYQEKVYEELKSIFPERDVEHVSAENIEQMRYLDQAINENMRLFAPVPLIGRSVSEDFELRKGLVIPKGVQILCDIFNMQRDESVWGPEAKTFNPDTCSPENMASKHPYAFVPFTKGIRSCVGNKYAILILQVILAKILRKYRIETDAKFEDLSWYSNITLQFKKFPQMRITTREN